MQEAAVAAKQHAAEVQEKLQQVPAGDSGRWVSEALLRVVVLLSMPLRASGRRELALGSLIEE